MPEGSLKARLEEHLVWFALGLIVAGAGGALAAYFWLEDFVEQRIEARVTRIEGTLAETRALLNELEITADTVQDMHQRRRQIEEEWIQLDGEYEVILESAQATVQRARNISETSEQLVRTSSDQVERLRDFTDLADLTEDQDFIDAVREDLQVVPPFVVIASTIECDRIPGSGWEEYSAASGRFIVGASDVYPLGEPGGEAEVTLDTDHMPAHSHDLSHDVWIESGGSHYGFDGNGYSVRTSRDFPFQVTNAGGGLPHNNMPPYIALYWCTPTTSEAG